MYRSAARRSAALFAALLFALAGYTYAATPALAAVNGISATATSGLVDGATLSVTVTNAAVTPATVFIAVTDCGNATSAGVAYATLPTDGSNCVGAEGLTVVDVTPGSLHLIGFPAGAVPAAGHTVAMLLKETGIGSAASKCIASPPAAHPCTVTASTATTAGAYTGAGTFTLTLPITYANNVVTTTTAAATTTAATTTTSGATTTTSGATTTTSGATTTTSGATTTTSGATTTTSGATTTTAATTTTSPATTTTAPATTTTKPATTLPSLVVSPNSGLTNAQVVNATVTLKNAAPAGTFLAVTECGNAGSNGVGYTAANEPSDGSNCVGAEGLTTIDSTPGSLHLIGFPAGPVAAGAHTVKMKLVKTGIGSKSAQCIPSPPAALPCTINASIATAAGAYTGAGAVSLAATITYQGTVVTTTTAGSGTTTSGATTTTSGTTTTTSGVTTTTGPLKSYDCTTIPLQVTDITVTPNRCLTDSETVTVSGKAGTFPANTPIAVIQCNEDPSIPQDGSGCNIAGVKLIVAGADGSVPATTLTVKSGQIGTNALSQCPPIAAQKAKGVTTCDITVSPVDPSKTALAVTTGITFAGETLTTGGTVPTSSVLGATVVRQANGTLAFTGGNPIPLIFLGLGLLDVGWLILTSTRPKRRRLRRSAA